MGQLPKDGMSTQQENHPEVVKKKYASPRLMEYGSLAKLTRGSGGASAETGGGSGNTKMCL